MDYLILFFIGLSVGSFLNVVVYRLRFGGSALKGRSFCDHCKKPIAWFDNIPLVSYLWLWGQCRKCKKKIPLEYPIVEAITGLEFVWVYWLLKINFSFFGQVEGFYSFGLLTYWLILFAGSLAIAIYDIKYMLIPNQVLLPLVVISLMRLFFSGQWQFLLVAVVSSLFLWVLRVVTKGRGMGWGDIQLAFLMGLVLGFPQVLVAYLIAFLTGAVGGVILMALNKRKFKDRIAFGPFLLLGMLAAKLWGWSIWQWYRSLL